MRKLLFWTSAICEAGGGIIFLLSFALKSDYAGIFNAFGGAIAVLSFYVMLFAYFTGGKKK